MERCGKPGVNFLSVCGGAVKGGQRRLTYLAHTDAECGLVWHSLGNVGYRGTHGGAKVAGYPGEAGRWAYIRTFQIALLLTGRIPTQPGQRREAWASLDPGGSHA